MKFPNPLQPGDLIAITAPSSGVPAALHKRLDLVINHLKVQGFRIIEGNCLRHEFKNASASAEERAHELNQFLRDPNIRAIFPPWGGELASELLDLIDFEALRSVEPKWLLGFSDLSTIQVPLTLISGWATAHGTNLMDRSPKQTDPLTRSVHAILAADFLTPVTQVSSALYREKPGDWAQAFDEPFNLTAPTRWKRLDQQDGPVTMSGCLIGGCIDTIAWLAGSRYADVPKFVQDSGRRGVILYLENCELAPPALVRALLAMRRARWFDHLSGLLIG